MHDILMQLTQALAVVLAGVLIAAVKRVATKYGLEIDAQQSAALQQSAQQAVLAVAETVEGSSEDKMHAALAKVADAHPNVADAVIADAIHAAIAGFRADPSMQLFQPKAAPPAGQ